MFIWAKISGTKTQNSFQSFEYDFKRRPVDPHPEYVRIEDGDDIVIVQHLAFDTMPWRTIAEFEACREVFARWRKGPPRRVLKTIRDWHDFEDYRHGGTASTAGIRRSRGGTVDQARRLIVNAITIGAWGLQCASFREAAHAMTDAGYPTTENDFKKARIRPKRLPEDPVLPADAPGIADFVAAITRIWPAFEPDRLLQKSE